MKFREATSKDKELIRQWLIARGMDESMVSSLPKLGVVASRAEELPILAAGYLREVEGGFGMIDSLIADPNSEPAHRNEALDGIITRLITDAKRIGMTALLANCKVTKAIVRAQQHGFQAQDFCVLTMNLKDSR